MHCIYVRVWTCGMDGTNNPCFSIIAKVFWHMSGDTSIVALNMKMTLIKHDLMVG